MGLSFGLCCDTVTVYRRQGDGTVSRVVYDKAFFDNKKVLSVDKTGNEDAMSFLLVVPGDADIQPQDKVIRDVGPEIGAADWGSFIPSKVPGLCVVRYVDKKPQRGKLSHTEAGG